MGNKTLAIATISGVAIITVAEAPNWRLESYAGWLGAMAGAAFVGSINAAVGNALAGLLMVSLVLGKGRQALEGSMSFVSGKVDQTNSAVYPFRTREMR